MTPKTKNKKKKKKKKNLYIDLILELKFVLGKLWILKYQA